MGWRVKVVLETNEWKVDDLTPNPSHHLIVSSRCLQLKISDIMQEEPSEHSPIHSAYSGPFIPLQTMEGLQEEQIR